MINEKVLLYGTKKEKIALKIKIQYEWNDDNDELVDKIIKNLPTFIEKQTKEKWLWTMN